MFARSSNTFKFSRQFDRRSPVEFGQKAEIPAGWFVVRFSHVEPMEKRRKTHGKWAKISSKHGSIFRVLRYSVNLPADNIVLDWAGWIDLQGRKETDQDHLTLTISNIRWYHFVCIPFKHVDPAYRLSSWIAVILGGLSVILGVLSIVLPWLQQAG